MKRHSLVQTNVFFKKPKFTPLKLFIIPAAITVAEILKWVILTFVLF